MEARLTKLGSRSLDCAIIPGSSIDADLELRWRAIHESNPRFASPYFHPQFTKCVAAVRDDIEVVVVTNDDRPVAFLPLQFEGPNRIGPVGGRLNDFHGMVCEDDFRLGVGEVLGLVDLMSWDFHALATIDQVSADSVLNTMPSPFLDLSRGYDAYFREVCRKSSTIKRQGQKTRGLIRDYGPLRFELSTRDPFLLEHLIALKREKYIRTRTFDVLSVEWCANLIRSVANSKVDGFEGFVSGLWAGDVLVASHVGMMTQDVLHYWFPAHEVNFGRYSPGTIMLQETARAAAEMGVQAIDLSYGPDPFKYKASNSSREVARGLLDVDKRRATWRRRQIRLNDALKRVPFKESIKRFGRNVFPNFGRGNYR